MAIVVDDKTAESANLNGYNEVVIMRNMETIDAFSSCYICKSRKSLNRGTH